MKRCSPLLLGLWALAAQYSVRAQAPVSTATAPVSAEAPWPASDWLLPVLGLFGLLLLLGWLLPSRRRSFRR